MRKNKNSPPKTKIAVFRGKEIRKTINENEWWFSVVDVVAVLTDSNNPRVYWNAMKARVKSDDGFQLSTICRQLKLEKETGRRVVSRDNYLRGGEEGRFLEGEVE